MDNDTEYGFVASQSPNLTTTMMNMNIKDGWRPQGGMVYDGEMYLQAMIRPKVNVE